MCLRVIHTHTFAMQHFTSNTKNKCLMEFFLLLYQKFTLLKGGRERERCASERESWKLWSEHRMFGLPDMVFVLVSAAICLLLFGAIFGNLLDGWIVSSNTQTCQTYNAGDDDDEAFV